MIKLASAQLMTNHLEIKAKANVESLTVVAPLQFERGLGVRLEADEVVEHGGRRRVVRAVVERRDGRVVPVLVPRAELGRTCGSQGAHRL